MRLDSPNQSQAVRLAMNAWLASDGAAAVVAIRKDPDLAELADSMLRIALLAYPEVFLEDPSLLQGHPDARWLSSSAANILAKLDPQAARRLIETNLVDSSYRDAVLVGIEDTRADQTPLSIEDANAELDSILAVRNRQERMNRLLGLVNRVARDNPEAAAELIDRMPRSTSMMAISSLLFPWTKQDPQAAARWLASRHPAESQMGMQMLARQWGDQDFQMASAFADTLKGVQRTSFLNGLAGSTQRRTRFETMAWLSRYEGDPAYVELATSVIQSLAQHDVYAAMALINNLPREAQLAAYTAVLPLLAMEDPHAAVRVVDGLDSEPVRARLLPTVASIWAEDDPQPALRWATSLESGSTRDHAMANVATSVVQFDLEMAIDALRGIKDSEVQDSFLEICLGLAESDEHALRLGRRFSIDRDTVLKLRENSPYSFYPSVVSSGSTFYSPNLAIISSVGQEEEVE